MTPLQPEPRSEPSTARRRIVFLVLGGAVMLGAAWAVAPLAGPPVAVMAGLFGWMACWITRLPPPAMRGVGTLLTEPAETAKPAAAPVSISTLRHDMRGILSPAMLISDRLLAHEDESVRRAGDVISRTVDRAAARLEQG